MKKTNIFIQSSQYIAEQSEPIKFIEFSSKPYLDESNIYTYRKQENFGRFKLVHRKNPYRSSWVNQILNKHYNIEIVEQESKIKIKKLPATEGASQTLINHLPAIQTQKQRDRSQFLSSISHYAKNNQENFFKQKRKYHISTSRENNSSNIQNSLYQQTEVNDVFSLLQVKSQDRLMPIFDVNFKTNLLQYNL
ncbi:unnamed protein product [Paramecium primaurelia]|uniref:Uncharacterized protein n=1 Tax=Paramecium primaurelia TaxID=5886 RepID=A0A8S1M6K2_PARPR|nr:unnamed protein product [Paramecium primaurelia]